MEEWTLASIHKRKKDKIEEKNILVKQLKESEQNYNMIKKKIKILNNKLAAADTNSSPFTYVCSIVFLIVAILGLVFRWWGLFNMVRAKFLLCIFFSIGIWIMGGTTFSLFLERIFGKKIKPKENQDNGKINLEDIKKEIANAKIEQKKYKNEIKSIKEKIKPIDDELKKFKWEYTLLGAAKIIEKLEEVAREIPNEKPSEYTHRINPNGFERKLKLEGKQRYYALGGWWDSYVDDIGQYWYTNDNGKTFVSEKDIC